MSRSPPRIVTVLLGALSGALFLVASAGCASLWVSIKASGAPGIGAALGAALGLLFGPVGAIVGAALGAIVTHGISENASLRSGETWGEGAFSKIHGVPLTEPWYVNVWLWAFVAYVAWRNWESIALFMRGAAGNRFWIFLRGLGHAAIPPLVTSPKRVWEDK